MKLKISVALPNDLLEKMDRADSNRSSFLEKAARQYLARMEKARRDARDAAILDSSARRLNREARNVLEYATSW